MATDDEIVEYTAAGVVVDRVEVPYPGSGSDTTEFTRDLVVDAAGRIHAYNGTFDPYLSTYVRAPGGAAPVWTHRTHPDWDTYANTTYGGIVTLGDHLYVTDTALSGAPANGLVRFDNPAAGDTIRFGAGFDYIDLALGPSGLLYALRPFEHTEHVHVYDPVTLRRVGAITLEGARDPRGLAVNDAGHMFVADSYGRITHYAAGGAPLEQTGFLGANLHDIDRSADGRLVAGVRDTGFLLTDETLDTVTIVPVRVPNSANFVAFGTLPRGGSVSGRHVFYNNSAYDTGGAGRTDDAAIATDKSALLPGGTPSAANHTNYAKGVNGVMVDVLNLPNDGAGLAAGDLRFRVDTPAGSWADAPQPQLSVRPGAGAGGADRVVLTWADGAIANRWLQVTLPAGTKTGLTAPDVFAFGNLAGDANGDRTVNIGDFGSLRQDFGLTGRTVADGRSDFNRDGVVNIGDFGILRGNFGKTLPPPPPTPTAVSPAAAARSAEDGSVLRPAAGAVAPPPLRKSEPVTRAVLFGGE